MTLLYCPSNVLFCFSLSFQKNPFTVPTKDSLPMTTIAKSTIDAMLKGTTTLDHTDLRVKMELCFQEL